MNGSSRRWLVIALGGSLGLAVMASPGSALAQEAVLRVAMGSPGETGIAAWQAIEAGFEAAHPGVDVELNILEDDLYQTIGLPNLLAGPDAPDIYFEWTGDRMAQRTADGYAADLSEAFASGPLAGLFDPALLEDASVDGKVVLVPHTQDVSNVLFYNVPLLAEQGIAPPTTWEGLLAACDALIAADITPIATGNKDLWAAGNWLSHLASRVVGEDVYAATLSGEAPFATPEWEEAFGYIAELREHSCVNESANSVDDTAGAQLFFQGRAAMHPIGSWLVSWAIGEAPDLDFDFVNLPAMPEGSAGDQASIIGVNTGHMVNAKSPNIDLAIDFLAFMNSPESAQAFTDAGLPPLTLNAPPAETDSRSARLAELLRDAPVIVLPPDTAYELKRANALYAAEAAVLGGQATPADALAALDAELAE